MMTPRFSIDFSPEIDFVANFSPVFLSTFAALVSIGFSYLTTIPNLKFYLGTTSSTNIGHP